MEPELVFFFSSVYSFLNCPYGSDSSISAICEMIFMIRLETTLLGLLIQSYWYWNARIGKGEDLISKEKTMKGVMVYVLLYFKGRTVVPRILQYNMNCC